MRVFVDILTGCELFSGAYDFEEVDGFFYKVTSRYVSLLPTGDIVPNDHPEAGDGVQVDEVKYHSKLDDTSLSKKLWLKSMKAWIRRVKRKIRRNPNMEEDEKAALLADFEERGNAVIPQIYGEYDTWGLVFVEEHLDDGMKVLTKWNEEAGAMDYYFLKHGCIEKNY